MATVTEKPKYIREIEEILATHGNGGNDGDIPKLPYTMEDNRQPKRDDGLFRIMRIVAPPFIAGISITTAYFGIEQLFKEEYLSAAGFGAQTLYYGIEAIDVALGLPIERRLINGTQNFINYILNFYHHNRVSRS